MIENRAYSLYELVDLCEINACFFRISDIEENKEYLLEKFKKDKVLCLVILFNTDAAIGHFTSFIIYKDIAYHFDSEAILPYPQIFVDLFKTTNVISNHNDIQGLNSNICGPMCVAYLNYSYLHGPDPFMFSTLFEDQYNIKNNEFNVNVCNTLLP
jgi:hypothetical protein